MDNTDNNGRQAGEEQGKLKRAVLPVTTILLVIVLSGLLFLFRAELEKLGNYGYLGIFLISLAFNATVFLPMPVFVVVFMLGATFNPVMVALAAASGGALGEITGYLAGASGRGIAPTNKMYIRAEGWMRRWGTMTVFIFALVPLIPFDLAALAAGALRFPIWKFLLACLFAKALLYTAVAMTGAWGWEAMLSFFG